MPHDRNRSRRSRDAPNLAGAEVLYPAETPGSGSRSGSASSRQFRLRFAVNFCVVAAPPNSFGESCRLGSLQFHRRTWKGLGPFQRAPSTLRGSYVRSYRSLRCSYFLRCNVQGLDAEKQLRASSTPTRKNCLQFNRLREISRIGDCGYRVRASLWD